MIDVHLPRIAPGLAPAALYVRVATSSGWLLDAHALDAVALAGQIGGEDKALADRWVADHPGETVHVYVYDGDDGRCLKTIVVGS